MFKVGGEICSEFLGFKPLHGISKITHVKGAVVKFEGFYHGNYFEMEQIFDPNIGEIYEVLKYKETEKGVEVDDDFSQLIDFVNNKKILEEYFSFSKTKIS